MKWFVILAATASLAACSAEPPVAANATADSGAVPAGSIGGVEPSPLPVAAARAPSGLPPETPPHIAPPLDPIDRADLEDRNLLGSGCAFRPAPTGPMLLVVRDEGDGLASFNRRRYSLAAATPGRDAIAVGGIVAGNGVSFTIRRTSNDPVAVRGSAQAWAATLDMRTADGGERVYRDGRWECGS